MFGQKVIYRTPLVKDSTIYNPFMALEISLGTINCRVGELSPPLHGDFKKSEIMSSERKWI